MVCVTRQRCLPASKLLHWGHVTGCLNIVTMIFLHAREYNIEIIDDVITRVPHVIACDPRNPAIAIVFNGFNQRRIYSTLALNYAHRARGQCGGIY